MVQSTSLATAARYEEDTPAASGDKGALILVVRNDAGGTLVDANGDYAPLQVNNLGELIVGGPGGVFTVVVVQPVHDLLNCNANIQVGDVDVSNANPVPVSDAGSSLTVDQPTHDLLNCNANIQVGDVDVGPANAVPISATALPLPALAATAANQGTMITALQLIDDLRNALDSVATDELHTKEQVGLIIDEYDHVTWAYDANGNLSTAVYRTGGGAGVIVGTLTWTYDANGNLSTVAKT